MAPTADVPTGHTDWPGEGVVLVDRYELVEFLSRGSVATLWRAHDSQLDRDVVVKILLHPHTTDETAVARFHREARAIARLDHPNVVRIFDTAEHDGLAFFVMEHVAGPSLSRFRGQALDARTVAALGYQVASALGAAHDTGLVHRDVKPANIVLAESTGRAKLLDFGITKALGEDSTLTDPQTIVATTRYAAPEQVSGDRVGPWSDVYSLGLLLWEACTGQPAFEGATALATALARLDHDPPPVSERVDHVPAVLDEVIQHATRGEHRARYPHGRAMADALYDLSGPRGHRDTRHLATPRPASHLPSGRPTVATAPPRVGNAPQR